jgi:hypothetical protein
MQRVFLPESGSGSLARREVASQRVKPLQALKPDSGEIIQGNAVQQLKRN